MTDLATQIDLLYGPPLSVLSDCLRGFLVPKSGHEFIGADFSAIEARVVAWLAGEEKILDVFRTHGKIYEAAAADIYSVPIERVTKDQRQIGKVAVLALGYQGGVGAFQAMARTSGVKVSDTQAESIKTAWREKNSNIVRYWYDLENAAKAAVMNPGRVTTAGPDDHRQIRYQLKGSFLACRLPSSRKIYYPYAKIKEVLMPWDELKDCIVYKAESSLSRKFEEQKFYGGLACENVTQAVARDILAEALKRIDPVYPVVLHVHDEVVSEVPIETQAKVSHYEELMNTLPAWATGLPVKSEGWKGMRYQK